jgi:response regulator of citrate/malate metabolism
MMAKEQPADWKTFLSSGTTPVAITALPRRPVAEALRLAHQARSTAGTAARTMPTSRASCRRHLGAR